MRRLTLAVVFVWTCLTYANAQKPNAQAQSGAAAPATGVTEIAAPAQSGRRGITIARPPHIPVDPVDGGNCLGGGCCSCPSAAAGNGRNPEDAIRPLAAPAARTVRACLAERTLRDLPQDIRDAARALGSDPRAQACRKAVRALLAERVQIVEAYANGPPRAMIGEHIDTARHYAESCLDDGLLQNRRQLSAAERDYLRSHVGFIVLRLNPEWEDAQPICHAARIGRFVVTAQHCVPVDATLGGYVFGYQSDISFRFMDRPTQYGLSLRRLGTEQSFVQERHADFAVLEIVGAPELNERTSHAAIGALSLFDDLILQSSNVYSRIAADIHSGTAEHFSGAVAYENSVLCRPAHVTPQGLFLHGCQTEDGTSGAPFFQRRDGRLVFVGLHNGRTDALETPDLSACAAGLPNYGIHVAPAELISFLQREEQQ